MDALAGRVGIRAVVVGLGVILAVVLAVLALSATPAQSAAKFQARNFSNPNQILIPGTGTSGTAAPYPSKVNVTGFPNSARVVDVNVKLRTLSHTFPDDIDVRLVGPNGRSAILMSDAGGTNDLNNVTFTLDDEAAIFMPDAGQITATSYQTSNYGLGDTWPTLATNNNRLLSKFDGLKPNGAWRLFVVDDAGGDTGSFNGGWTLRIRAKIN